MKNKSDIAILIRMSRELGNLTPIILLTILFGVGGYVAASGIATVSAAAAVSFFGQSVVVPLAAAVLIIVLCAVLRGFLRYLEQLSGHYIAFKILATLRDKVFAKLRELAPAKLDTHEKGSLISVITSDIEMMEVFYAHTIAPVLIAVVTSAFYTAFLWHIHFVFGLFAATVYILIGLVLPIIFNKTAAPSAKKYRHQLGSNSSYILDTMRGLKEILQFGAGIKRKQQMSNTSEELGKSAQEVKQKEAVGFAATDMIIVLSLLGCIAIGYVLHTSGKIDGALLVITVTLLVSSFGPVVALSSLSTTLAGTIAGARRVFDILDESPVVEDIPGDSSIGSYNADYNKVSFAYPSRNTQVLKDVSLNINENEHIAIEGSSGSGKSTMLKLLMRFYDPSMGKVSIGGKNLKTVPTGALRNSQTILNQNAFLFSDTIENNIRMENESAAMQDVINAAKKAAIHDAIEKLPNGYQTNAGELGERFSSGEKQRIALARAFLAGGRILILDEPTSNLDVLSEAQILRSIKQHCKSQSVILVSHRASTTAICSKKVIIESGKLHTTKKA